MFTVTTFDTFIYFFFNRRKFFQIFYVNIFIIIDDHTGIQQIIRINGQLESFSLFHTHRHPILFQQMAPYFARFHVLPLKCHHIFPLPVVTTSRMN